MDPGKERFFRNYILIKRFASEGEIPKANFRDFLCAIADLFYNFRRERKVKYLRSNSITFKCFMRKNVPLIKRESIFKEIPTTIKAVLIHLLNEKILHVG